MNSELRERLEKVTNAIERAKKLPAFRVAVAFGFGFVLDDIAALLAEIVKQVEEK